jgi:hypothetical protein
MTWRLYGRMGFHNNAVLEHILGVQYEFGVVWYGCDHWRSGVSRCFTKE